MRLLLGGSVLLIIGVILRRVLRLGSRAELQLAIRRLPPACQAIYAAVAMEVETQLAILSVVLNDAIEERNSGRAENSWRLVRLSVSEWQRLAGIITEVLDALQANIPRLRNDVSYRSTVIRLFRSRPMINYSRLPELLIRLTSFPKVRFRLQVDLLRRSAAILAEEFNRTHRYGERIEDRSPEVWERLDLYLYDFDLLSKEALLALRACLKNLPETDLTSFNACLEPILRRGVRAPSVPVDERAET